MYYKITEKDCLSVATPAEKIRLAKISDFAIFESLAQKWAHKNGYTLGHYNGHWSWDAWGLYKRKK